MDSSEDRPTRQPWPAPGPPNELVDRSGTGYGSSTLVRLPAPIATPSMAQASPNAVSASSGARAIAPSPAVTRASAGTAITAQARLRPAKSARASAGPPVGTTPVHAAPPPQPRTVAEGPRPARTGAEATRG